MTAIGEAAAWIGTAAAVIVAMLITTNCAYMWFMLIPLMACGIPK